MSGLLLRDSLRDHYAGYYDGVSEWCDVNALDKCANIAALCRDLPHDAVLEIGAGEGAVLQGLADLAFGRSLHALEVSEPGLEALASRGIPALDSARAFDGYQVPYPDGRFDLAILSHVVEHVEYPRKLLYEAARVARFVFVEVPLEDHLRRPRDFAFDEVGHINFYSPRSIRSLVQTCGLQVLEQIVTNPSRRVYAYRDPRRGALKHCVKEIALRLAPPLAIQLWTYHSALVCRSPRPRS